MNEKITKVGMSVNGSKFRVKTDKTDKWIYFLVDLISEKYVENNDLLLDVTISFEQSDLESKGSYYVLSALKLMATNEQIKSLKEKGAFEPLVDTNSSPWGDPELDFTISEYDRKNSVSVPEAIDVDDDEIEDEIEVEVIEEHNELIVEEITVDNNAIKEMEEDVESEDIQVSAIPEAFDYGGIYDSQEDDEFETVSVDKNRKMQDLLNQTLEDNSRALYYRTSTKGRSLNYSEIALFDDGLTSDFLMNKTDVLRLKAPKQLDKVISNIVLENSYSDFYTKKDYELYKSDDMGWGEFSFKINKKLNARYQIIKVIAGKATELKKETGNWVFYAAWPFITGFTTKNKVRTPFMFTPIEVLYSNGTYVFKKTSNPLKINSQLIQTLYSEKRRVPKNLTIYFNTMEEVFQEYAKHGIVFSNQLGPLEPLRTIKKSDFETSQKVNNYSLKNMAIFENIIKSDDVYNDALRISRQFNEFKLPETNINLFEGDKLEDEEYDILPFNIDKNKNFVVSSALEDSLTIFGPPGTGKSEVITSILVKSVSDGYTNLVVSEKDAALSVLVSRLKKKYDMDMFTLKLNGNTMTNKSVFWGKVEYVIETIRAKQKNVYSDPIINDRLLETLEKFNEFKGHAIESGIEEEKFIIGVDKIEHLFGFAKSRDNQISKHIINVRNAIKDFAEGESKIEELSEKRENNKTQMNDLRNEIDSLDMQIHSLLAPPLSYLPYSYIDFRLIKNFGNNHKELFKYLSNKHYSILKLGKAFKENQVQIIKLIDLIDAYETLKNTGTLEQMMVQDEKDEDDLKALTIRNKELTSTILKKGIEEVNIEFELSEDDINELQSIQDLYIDYYSEEYDDTNKLAHDFKIELMEVFEAAKTTFKANTIEYIADKISDDEDLMKQLNGLNRMAGYGVRSQQKPGLIIKKYFEIISTIFPIIIATPNEVSRYLPDDPDIFDYGIFDEASQMFVHRAFPSIHRCEKVIIAGDEKQLSPSNWFKAAADVEYNEDDYDFDEDGLAADSLLSWGKGRYKKRLLDVHYRSQSSKLIEYSNITFYKGKLKSIDTPYAKSNPIELINVHGEWTKDRDNMEEAEAVVERVARALSEYDSIGVVTINKSQQALITECIEQNPALAKIYHSEEGKSIFVKNIENVQGDEADIIIFSLGYAPKDGVMKVGNLIGVNPNRLNVAITRAKCKMVIFNSFESSELGIGSEGTGRNTLYKWVHWLENNTKGFDDSMATKMKNYENKFRSPFESEFYELLQKYLSDDVIVRANYNSNGYEIDLVFYNLVEGRFVGAIELDGAMYHSDAKAIADDMQKTNFLESLGWNLIRVSSTGFWRDKEKTVKTAFDRLKL